MKAVAHDWFVDWGAGRWRAVRTFVSDHLLVLRNSPAPYLLAGLLCVTASAALAQSLTSAVIQKPALYVLAILVGLVVFRFPWLLLGFVVLVDQYVAQGQFADQVPAIGRAGSTVYSLSKSGVPAMVGVATIAAVGSYLRLRRSARSASTGSLRVHAGAHIFETLVVSVLLLYAAVYLLEYASLPFMPMIAGFLRAASSLLLMLCAYLVAAETFHDRTRALAFTRFVGAVVIVKALYAIYTWATSGGATVDGQSGVVFFEAGTPLMGVAVLGAWAAGVSFRTWQSRAVVVGAAICIVASFRLTIFLAAALALLCGALLTYSLKGRRRVVLAGISAAFVLLVVPLGGSALSALQRALSLDALFGSSSSGGTSASLHVDDVQSGLQLALESPILGLGANARQPTQFADFSSTSLYVHNEYLQQWLTFGAIGLLATISIFAYAMRVGAQTVRSLADSPLVASAGVLLGIVWLPLLSAPFFSTTQRLPVLLGAAFAVSIVGYGGGHYAFFRRTRRRELVPDALDERSGRGVSSTSLPTNTR